MTRTIRSFLRPAVAVAMATALGLGALASCGSDDPPAAASGAVDTAATAAGSSVAESSPPPASDSAGSSSADKKAAGLVPKDIRDKGKLAVATDVSYPPFEFFDTDNTTIVGADAELVAAIGKVLDLDIDLQNTPFDGIVPGIAAGKFDIALSGLADTAERRSQVTFVDYAANGAGFLLNAADAPTYIGYASLCGVPVAVQSGTTMAEDLADASAKVCEGAGKPAIGISNYKTQDEGVLALNSQRAKVMVTTGGSGAYIVTQSSGKLAVVMPNDSTRERSALGIAVGKDQPELAKAVQAAVGELIANGTYDAIMKKWTLSECCSNKKNTINNGS